MNKLTIMVACCAMAVCSMTALADEQIERTIDDSNNLMKTVLCLVVAALLCGMSSAFTPDEAFRVSECLMERFKSSGEWVDHIGAADGEEVDVGFPSAESLFEGEFPSNILTLARTASERRLAFDSFLSDLSRTNSCLISRAYGRTGSFALLFCDEKGYAEGVVAATNILARPSAPCRVEAHDIARGHLRPSRAANALMETVLTNNAEFGDYRNAALLSRYATRLAADDSLDAAVVSNGIAVLCRAATNVWAKKTMDELMARRVPSYAASSNRLDAALAALREPTLSARDRAYFVAVTNEILSAAVDGHASVQEGENE